MLQRFCTEFDTGKENFFQITIQNNNLTWKHLSVNISPQSSLSAVAYQNDLLKNAYEFCFLINGFGVVYLKQFKNNRYFVYHTVDTADGHRTLRLYVNDNGEISYVVTTDSIDGSDACKILQIWYR